MRNREQIIIRDVKNYYREKQLQKFFFFRGTRKHTWKKKLKIEVKEAEAEEHEPHHKRVKVTTQEE